MTLIENQFWHKIRKGERKKWQTNIVPTAEKQRRPKTQSFVRIAENHIAQKKSDMKVTIPNILIIIQIIRRERNMPTGLNLCRETEKSIFGADSFILLDRFRAAL